MLVVLVLIHHLSSHENEEAIIIVLGIERCKYRVPWLDQFKCIPSSIGYILGKRVARGIQVTFVPFLWNGEGKYVPTI